MPMTTYFFASLKQKGIKHTVDNWKKKVGKMIFISLTT